MKCADCRFPVLLRVVAAVAALSAAPAAAQAQWRVGAEFGLARFSGGSRRIADDSVSLEPYGPVHYRIAGSYQRGAWQVTVGLLGSTPGVGGDQDGLIIVFKNALDMLAVEATIGRRLVSTSSGGQLFLEAGPAYNLWSTSLSDDFKSGFGVTAAATLQQRLTGRLGSRIRVHAAVSPSFLDPDAVPSGLERANVWRLGLAVGLDFRL